MAESNVNVPTIFGVPYIVKSAIENNTGGLGDAVSAAAAKTLVMVEQGANGTWAAPTRGPSVRFLWIGETHPSTSDGWANGDAYVNTSPNVTWAATYLHLATVTNGAPSFPPLPADVKAARSAGRAKVIWYRATAAGLAPDPGVTPKHADYVGTVNGSVVDLIEGFDPAAPKPTIVKGVFASDSLVSATQVAFDGRQLDKFAGGNAAWLMAWKTIIGASNSTKAVVDKDGGDMYGGDNGVTVVYDTTLTPLPDLSSAILRFKQATPMDSNGYANDYGRIMLGGTSSTPSTGPRWGIGLQGLNANGGTPAYRRLIVWEHDGTNETVTPLINFPNGYDLYGKGDIKVTVNNGAVTATVDTYTSTTVNLTSASKSATPMFALQAQAYSKFRVRDLVLEIV